MNNATRCVQEVKPLEDMARKVLHNFNGNPMGVVSLNYLQEVLSIGLKHHTHMRSMWSKVHEMVEKNGDILLSRPLRDGRHSKKKLDLFTGSLFIGYS